MLKALWLTILGWLRLNTERNTDLSIAGREHFRQIEADLEKSRHSRNELLGESIILENEIKADRVKLQEHLESMQYWDKEGDTGKRDRAYTLYTELLASINEKEERNQGILDSVDEVDQAIKSAEAELQGAKSQLKKAATDQKVGRVNTSIENVHRNISSGPLAGVIETSKQDAATAEAARRTRKANDHSDLKVPTKAPSMEELLGKTGN